MPTLTLPLTVAPAAGLVNAAAGGFTAFCTVTDRVNCPPLLVASRTWATSVRGPFGVRLVSHGTVTCRPGSACDATTTPFTLRVNVLEEPLGLSTQMSTQVTPLTVAPAAGLV